MQPTSRELLESIRWALDEKVAPVVDDRWAASTLRSVQTLLDHLVVRVECEHALALETRDDLRGVLTEARGRLDDATGSVWAGLLDELEVALEGDAAPASLLPSLAAEATLLQDLCDRLLRALRSEADRVPSHVAEEVHTLLRRQLARQLERERPLFMPAFMGKLF